MTWEFTHCGCLCELTYLDSNFGFHFILMLMLLLALQIKVSNSALISAFMTDLEGDAPVTQVTHDLSLEIGLSTRKILCSNFTLVALSVIMIDCNYLPTHIWREIWTF